MGTCLDRPNKQFLRFSLNTAHFRNIGLPLWSTFDTDRMIYFPNDSYQTPENKKRSLGDRLSFNTRWYFVLKYIQIVLSSRRIAVSGKYDTAAWAVSSINIFRLLENCGGKFFIEGLDNVHKLKEPVVFIGNHMSTLETMILPCLIAPSREVTFVAKESLVKQHFFGPILRARNPVVVGRTDSRADLSVVLEQGKKLLDQGTSVIIFPQSTRRTELRPEEFNSLGVKLARSAGVQVVPIALKTDFWGNGKLMSHLGPLDRKQSIHFAFGPPSPVTGSGKEENAQIIRFIQSRLSDWANR